MMNVGIVTIGLLWNYIGLKKYVLVYVKMSFETKITKLRLTERNESWLLVNSNNHQT